MGHGGEGLKSVVGSQRSEVRGQDRCPKSEGRGRKSDVRCQNVRGCRALFLRGCRLTIARHAE